MLDALDETNDGEPVPERNAIADQWRLLGRVLRRRRPQQFAALLELLEVVAVEIPATGESDIPD